VKSPQWFRYDMKVIPDQPLVLRCTFRKGEKECTSAVLIDGLPVAAQKPGAEQSSEFFDVQYPLPADAIRGKNRITVMMRAKEGRTTCELYGCAVVKGRQ